MSRLVAPLLFIAFAAASAPAFQPAPTAGTKTGRTGLPEGARFRFSSGGVQLSENITAAALSFDGKALVYSSAQPGLTVVDLKTGKPLYKIESDAQEAPTLGLLTFSPDGKKIAYAGAKSIVVTDNRPDAGSVKTVQLGEDGPLRVQTLSLSTDGKFIAAGVGQGGNTRKQFGHVWETDTGKLLAKLETLQNSSASVALSPDGKTLATWGKHFARMIGEDMTAGQSVQLWDVATGKELHRLKMDRAGANVSYAAFAPNGKTLAVASGLSTFQLFDVITGKEQRRFSGRRGMVTLLQFSPDGRSLVAGSFDGGLQAWRTETGQRLDFAAAPKTRLLSFAFPEDGQVIALGMQGQTLTWWDAAKGPTSGQGAGHQTPILSLTFTPEGKALVSASSDGKVFRWDVATGKAQRQFMLVDDDTMRVMPGGVRLTTLMLSPDARFATTSNIYSPNSLRLWNLATAQVVCDFEAARPVNSFALGFSPGGDRLMSTTAKAIEVWETETGQERPRLDFQIGANAGGGQPRLALSPDGKLVAIALADRDPETNQLVMRVVLLDAETGKELQVFEGAPVFQNGGAAFSPDSKVLAMPAVGRSIALMRVATGKEWKRLGSGDPAELVSAISFSPDSRSVALAVSPGQTPEMPAPGSQPASIEVWELSSGTRRKLYRGHVGAVNGLVYSPDGALLASGGADATVVLWDLYRAPEGSRLASAKELDDAWTNLAKEEAGLAYLSLCGFVATPMEGIAFLKKKLQPAKEVAVETKDIEKHVGDLDSDTFETRAQAFRALEKSGSTAEPALRKARAGKTSLEMQRRIDDLLDRVDRNTFTPEELQGARAVEALERIASPEARALLQELTQGAASARLTGEAQRALRRLEKK